MNKLIHTQNIDTIHMHFEMQLYCPQGFEHYTGTFDVDFCPGEYLPDYCELDKLFREKCGSSMIVEDAVNWVYNTLMQEYAPEGLSVRMSVQNALHFDVTIEKGGWPV